MPKETSRFVILGCGHTGSTLISGIFKLSGFNTLPPINSNFESDSLNSLVHYAYGREKDSGFKRTVKEFLRELEGRTNGQWCIKDPLLPFLIEDIYPLFENKVKFVFNFRNPQKTVSHLIEERKTWWSDLTERQASKSAQLEWYYKNLATLNFLERINDPFLMIDYNDLLKKKSTKIINTFVGKQMNYQFINPSKESSKPVDVEQTLEKLYQDLKDREVKNHEKIMSKHQVPPEKNTWNLFAEKLKYQHFRISRRLKRAIPYFIYRKLYLHRPSLVREPFPNHEEQVKNELDFDESSLNPDKA